MTDMQARLDNKQHLKGIWENMKKQNQELPTVGQVDHDTRQMNW